MGQKCSLYDDLSGTQQVRSESVWTTLRETLASGTVVSRTVFSVVFIFLHFNETKR